MTDFRLLPFLFASSLAVAAPSRPAPAKPAPSVPAPAADSLLRVACDEDGAGAEVSINGKFKGECPIDIALAEGLYKLRVLKPVDALHERDFMQEVRMGSGVVKKVEVALSAPHLTEEGRRQEEVRRAAAAKAEEERRAAAARAEAERQRVADEAARREQAAFAAVLARAEAGDTPAMVEVARRYGEGAGVAADEVSEASWLEKAASKGDPGAMFTIGTRYENGIGVQKDYAKAYRWYRPCADAGHAPCVGAVSAFFLNGWGVPRDLAQAVQWARKGETLQSGRAVFALANLHQAGLGGLEKDMEKYQAYVLQAARLGEPRAMYYQALMELKTDPWPQEQLDKSRAWLEKAVASGAEGGYAEAKSLYWLGKFYLNGQGVRKDLKTAGRMIERAAQLEDADAMSLLGLWYMEEYKGENPIGKRDDKVAAGLFRKAAEAGEPEAMQNLAYFYYYGKGGLPLNQALGKEWQQKAANARLARAFAPFR
ncbi:PEGA domain-containing protein [Massilia endophytica]|uniref:PEGA domain-containing protein n=1 Tax=Massilia endophytica TaxID=2899220 RepID=UPI001E36863B|nr:PEGA domain-containing protein [Massilia endophytica]UGQ45159.1 PEGA domain-containing protein [Massilia endophytica]